MVEYRILIPAYNAASTLAQLLQEINQLENQPRSIVVVDDGSQDATADIAKAFNTELIQNERNRGKGFSLRAGFNKFLNNSKNEYLLCMDADLQHPVSSIPKFIEAAQKSSEDIIIGNRSKKWNEMPFFRVISNRTTSALLTRLTGKKIKDSQCGFRLIHHRVLEQIQLKEDGFQLESEFIIQAVKNGHSITFVDIPTIYNQENSNINHLGDTLRFIKLFLKGLRW